MATIERAANAAATQKAALKPLTNASGCGVPLSIKFVLRVVKTVVRIAIPSAPPICWDVLISPDASPASVGWIPERAAMETGTKAKPRPTPTRRNPGSMQLVLCTQAFLDLLAGSRAEPRVLDGERGELSEPVEKPDLVRAERPTGVGREETEDAEQLLALFERDTDDRVQSPGIDSSVLSRPVLVVVDEHRFTGFEDPPGDTLAGRCLETDEGPCGPGCNPNAESAVGRARHVEVAAIGVDEGSGPSDDGLEQLVEIETVEEVESGVVQCSELVVLAQQLLVGSHG